jgi:cation transport ATPase
MVIPGLSLGNFLLMILTTPVQFRTGKRFYVNAFKVLKHGGANMDVLIVIGTSASYFYSVMAIFSNVMSALPSHHRKYNSLKTKLHWSFDVNTVDRYVLILSLQYNIHCN